MRLRWQHLAILGPMVLAVGCGGDPNQEEYESAVSLPILKTLAPVGDTYIVTGSSQNHGSETKLRVDGTQDSGAAQSYLQFVVSAPVAGATRVELVLRSDDSSGNGGNLYATQSFDETRLTGKNAPSKGAKIGTVGSANANADVVVDVTSVVSGTGTYAFVIASTNSDGVWFGSREGSHTPLLRWRGSTGTGSGGSAGTGGSAGSGGSGGSTGTAGPPCTTSSSEACRRTLTVGSGRLAYYGSYSLDQGHSSAKRAIIVVHGTDRNARDYYGYLVSAASTEGATSSVILLAPHFQEKAASSGELYWSSDDWKEGGDGTSSAGGKASSFAAIDALVDRLADRSRFPTLTEVIVTGHSAGGQVMQRYAAGARSQPSVLAIRYVPANPSSYMYLNAFRLVNGSWSDSGGPLESCSSYDNYKYGLKKRSDTPYMASQSDADLRSKYVSRQVTYLLGAEDTCNSDQSPCDDHSLDKTCQAMVQGDFRLVRGQNHFAHLARYYPENHHVLQNVRGISHDGKGMLNSPEGRAVLFH